jgi:hypothetical protein
MHEQVEEYAPNQKVTDHRLDRKSLLSYLQTQGAQTNDKRLKLPGQLTCYSTTQNITNKY